jgi:hypothetical protein
MDRLERIFRPRHLRVRRRLVAPGLGWVAGFQFPKLAFLAVLGPGIVSGFADNDAGGITTDL